MEKDLKQTYNTAAILTIGDELLIGQTVDTNGAWIGQHLNSLGIDIVQKLTISDEHDTIVDALDDLTALADIVLVTGGLGPTNDDVTKLAIADFLEDEMVFDEGTWTKIQHFFNKLGRSTTDAHRAQCYIPESAILLPNNMGTAPGMKFSYASSTIISMPGVPYEMKYIMSNSVLPMIAGRQSLSIVNKTLQTSGRGETMIAQEIQDIVNRMPKHLSMAYLPNLGSVRLRITAKGHNEDQLKDEVEQYTSLIRDRLGVIVYGEGEINLAQALGNLLIERNLNIMTAESCTGGHVASQIVDNSGSSAYYLGSLVTYSNTLKMKMLNVSHETLTQHGAVSEATVREMVCGGLHQLEADICIAISGIAGPSGGSPEKPVGTIWMAVGNEQETFAQVVHISKDRSKNIEYSSNRALDMARRFILKHY